MDTYSKTPARFVRPLPAGKSQPSPIDGTPRGFADTVRMLRTTVVRHVAERGQSTIGVISPRQGEGKTFIAAHLAIALALDCNHTVLLVDANLRRPALHGLFGISSEPGLSNHLLDGTPLAACLTNPGLDGLTGRPAGRPGEGSSEVLLSRPMCALATELRYRYPERIVVYDLPGALITDDVQAFMQMVEGYVLIVGTGVTRKDDIEDVLSMLRSNTLICTVLNHPPSGGVR